MSSLLLSLKMWIVIRISNVGLCMNVCMLYYYQHHLRICQCSHLTHFSLARASKYSNDGRGANHAKLIPKHTLGDPHQPVPAPASSYVTLACIHYTIYAYDASGIIFK